MYTLEYMIQRRLNFRKCAYSWKDLSRILIANDINPAGEGLLHGNFIKLSKRFESRGEAVAFKNKFENDLRFLNRNIFDFMIAKVIKE